MMKVLKSGVLYFVLVFGAGFVLGPIRILWIVPHVGMRAAELMESPVMLVVIFASARWIVRHLGVPDTRADRLGMGLLALGLLLAAEFALGYLVFGLSITETILNKDPVSGTVYYLLLVVFALMPLFAHGTIN